MSVAILNDAFRSVIVLSVVMVNVAMLNVIVLSVVMLISGSRFECYEL